MSRDPNLIERFLQQAGRLNGLEPERCLLACLILLRGGHYNKEKIREDYNIWVDTYGEPDMKKLNIWSGILDIEADIAETMLKSNDNYPYLP